MSKREREKRESRERERAKRESRERERETFSTSATLSIRGSMGPKGCHLFQIEIAKLIYRIL